LKARGRVVETLQHQMLHVRLFGTRVFVRTKPSARVAPDANGFSAMETIRVRHYYYSDSDRDSATHNEQRSPDAGRRAPQRLQYDERKGKNWNAMIAVITSKRIASTSLSVFMYV